MVEQENTSVWVNLTNFNECQIINIRMKMEFTISTYTQILNKLLKGTGKAVPVLDQLSTTF
jgi:hypothetical protein